MTRSKSSADATIDWDAIRPQPDRKASFEEICSQLLRREPHAADARFQRQGLNDKGCEALWRSATAGDIGVQAKFFTKSLGAGEFGQIDSSVRTALANFPNLVHYIVCVPTLLSDTAGTKNGKKLKTARDRWDEHRSKWLTWSTGRAKPVAFELWDAHDLQLRVQGDVGLRFYWFGDPPLTADWAKEQFKSTLDRVQERYTPKLNVALPLSSAADGLLRSDRFLDTVFTVYREAKKAVDQIKPSSFPEGPARDGVTNLCESMLQSLHQLLLLDGDRHAAVDWAQVAAAALQTASGLARHYDELPVVKRYDDNYGTYDEAGYRIRSASRALRQLAFLARSWDTQLATNPVMILIGAAGTGKTHFLCDIVDRALADGQFALMMLSEQFDAGDPLQQMINFYGLACTADEFLGTLDSLAIASDRGRSLVIIDALNEFPSDTFWQRRLAKLMRQVKKYPHVGLIISLRTDHEKTLLDDPIRSLGVVVRHEGFSYALFEAQRIYFAEYNIRPPGPLLSREYENPLYLKTLCDTLKAEGLHHIPAGHRSIIELLNRHLRVIGKRIALALEEDPAGDFASEAINALADAYAASGTRLLPYDTAEQIIQAHQHVPRKSFQGSLFRQLISENILAVTTIHKDKRVVRFMYEKIADHAIAGRIIDNAITAKGTDAAIDDSALIAALNPSFAVGFSANTLNALVIQIPERLGVEVADVTTNELAREAALHALPSRAPESLTARTAEIVSEALGHFVPGENIWQETGINPLLENVVALATIPGHPLDSRFLHQHLLAMTLPLRDSFWTVRVNRADPDHTLLRVLAWSRTAELAMLDIETKVGLATILCWMTSSSHRGRRDHATKTLAQLMRDDPVVTERMLADFRECNDPYVTERLLCAVYGAALMTAEPSARRRFAEAVYQAVFASGRVPTHILSREYARLTVQLAVDDGLIDLDPQTFRPPYGSDPPKLPKRNALDWQKFEAASNEQEQTIFAVRHSLSENGDFARYVVGTNSGYFPFTNTLLSLPAPVSRAIAERRFDESLDAHQRELQRASRFDFWNDERSKAETTKALAAATKAEHAFEESLSAEQLRLRECAKAAETSPSRVDLRGVCNWLYARGKSLGLAKESLGDHDLDPSYRTNRDEHGVERIGKKYQWIAYYELLARYADNFWMHGARFDYDRDYQRFDTTVAIGKRNIDPTVFLKLELPKSRTAWWSGETIDDWEDAADLDAWLRTAQLPNPESLLSVRDENGRNWFCVDTVVTWDEPAPRVADEYDEPRARIVYQLRAFLVRVSDAESMEALFLGKPLRETRHIEEVSAGDTFLQELPSAYFARQPFPLHATFENIDGIDMYPATIHFRGLDRDAAAEGFATIAPSPLLATVLALGCNEENAWRDASGVCAFDPSNGSPDGSPALLVRADVLGRLDPNYELCWVLSGENQVVGGMGRFRMPGRIEASGFWRLKGQASPVGSHRFDWAAAAAPARGAKKRPARGATKQPARKTRSSRKKTSRRGGSAEQ